MRSSVEERCKRERTREVGDEEQGGVEKSSKRERRRTEGLEKTDECGGEECEKKSVD